MFHTAEFLFEFEFPKYFVNEANANLLHDVCLIPRAGSCQLLTNEVISVSTSDIAGPNSATGEDF